MFLKKKNQKKIRISKAVHCSYSFNVLSTVFILCTVFKDCISLASGLTILLNN